MAKEKRFEINLQTYDGVIDSSAGSSAVKEPISDARLIVLCLELQRVDSMVEMRRVDAICRSVEAADTVLLLSEEHRDYLKRKMDSMSWNPAKDIRRAVISLYAKVEMAKEVEVEVAKA